VPEAPDLDLDQEKDEVTQETTDTLTISQEISKRIGVNVGVSKSDQGDKEISLGITVRFTASQSSAGT
jgi:hypothetical protein